MNGNKSAVLDSNILIYLSKGQLDFGVITANYDNLYLSVVTYMEVLGFNFSNPLEQVLMRNLIKLFNLVHTDMRIADRVVDYRKIKKIKIPDAIILATAHQLNADIITVNEQDFVGVDENVEVVNPNPPTG
jgi:predicted nucleic acid-binding protein